MTSDTQSTYDVLCELLAPFNSGGVALQPSTDISSDLNIDSVSVMDFVMEVEDRFDIDIPLNVLSETRTLNDLVAVVEARTGKGK
jgi:acyl carrier protein